MSQSPITDRLITDLRGRLDSFAHAAEDSRAFRGNEFAYRAWLERHAKSGHVLHRDSAAAKTARLHRASCSKIGIGEDDVPAAKGPKVGSPTKAAASAYAMQSKWKVIADCEECAPKEEA